MAGKADYQAPKPEHLKLLDEADGILAKAFAEARDKTKVMRSTGEQHPPEGTFRCFRCNCEEFMSGPSGGAGHPAVLTCRRAGCHHSFFSHDVF